MTEIDNRPMWTPRRPGTYEVWFLTISDRATGHGYWIRSTIEAPANGATFGTVWFARFDPVDQSRTFGLHRGYDSDVRADAVGDDGFEVAIGPSLVRPGLAEGELDGDGHEVTWSLHWPTGDPTYRLLPDWMYRGSVAPTHPLSPNPATQVSGTITVDGERFGLRGAHGQQGHLAGRRHAERWAWAHCSDFDDEEAVVQALTAQGRRGPVLTPFVTSIGVRWDGRWIRLTKFGKRRTFGLGSWRIDAGDRRYRLTGRIEAPVRDLLRARYRDPDGLARYCHNSEIASCRLALFERRAGGFEEVALLESRGTTHAEWAGRTPAAAVGREHVDVTDATGGGREA